MAQKSTSQPVLAVVTIKYELWAHHYKYSTTSYYRISQLPLCHFFRLNQSNLFYVIARKGVIKDQGRPLCPPSGLVWCSKYSTKWWFIEVNISKTSTLLVRIPTGFSKVSWWMLLFFIDTNNHWKILVSPKDHYWKVRMMPSVLKTLVALLRYESSTLILFKELSIPIFQSLSVSE